MKLNSIARMSEIERTVKNSRFGPERTANDREEAGKTRNKEDRAQKRARAAIIYQQSTRPRAC